MLGFLFIFQVSGFYDKEVTRINDIKNKWDLVVLVIMTS